MPWENANLDNQKKGKDVQIKITQIYFKIISSYLFYVSVSFLSPNIYVFVFFVVEELVWYSSSDCFLFEYTLK
jgi:hypothetical protein